MCPKTKNETRLPILKERLNELMGDMNVTEFAEKVGLTRQTMSAYLNGNRIPDSLFLKQICQECNISADWLLGLPGGTRSTDPNIKAVVQYTGLTEENTIFLHDPSKAVGDDGPLNFFRKSLYILINDLIDICRDKGSPFEQFYEIQRTLSLFDRIEAPNPNDDFSRQYTEGIIKESGRVTLGINESIDYRAEKIAETIANGIYEKYSAQERTEPNGTPEIIEIEGNQVKIYKE